MRSDCNALKKTRIYAEVEDLHRERTLARSEHIDIYVADTIDRCCGCCATSTPVQPIKVSKARLSTSHNAIVCVDYFNIEEYCLFHALDVASRYSAANLVPDLSGKYSTPAFEASCIPPF